VEAAEPLRSLARSIALAVVSARLYFRLDREGRVVAASAVGPDSSVARDIRPGEMLTGSCVTPDPARLADPSIPLKRPLRS